MVESTPAKAGELPSSPQILGQPALWGLLAVGAYGLSQGLAPALPGSMSGADRAIDSTLLISAGLSQLSAMLFVVLSVRLLLPILARPNFTITKTVISFTTAIVSASVVLSASGVFSLRPIWFLTIALAVATSGMLVAKHAGTFPQLRAQALVVVASSLAGLGHAGARLLAGLSSGTANTWGYSLARAGSTLAWLCEVGAFLVAAVWLLASQRRRTVQALATLTFAASSAVAWNANPKSGLPLLMHRAAQQLRNADPQPLLPAFVQDLSALCTLSLCALAALSPGRPGPARIVICLALLSRGLLDVPLGALYALCSYLILFTLHAHQSRPSGRLSTS